MKKFFFFIMWFLFCSISKASECYHYHVSTTFEIKKKNTTTLLYKNTLDPNGISIWQSQRIVLASVFDENWKIDGIENNLVFLSNNHSYYILNTDTYDFEKEKPILLYAKKEITDRFQGALFKKDGEWYAVTYSSWDKKVTRQKVSGFPDNAYVVDKTVHNAFLIKNEKDVYTCRWTDGKLQVTKIEGITAGTMKFVKPAYAYNTYFLYDNDTFYFLNSHLDVLEDISKEFERAGVKEDLASLTFISTDFLKGFKSRHNVFWAYVEAGVTLENGRTVHFYAVEQAEPTANDLFVKIGEALYMDSWNAVYKVDKIDISQVKHIDKLRKLNDFYYYDEEYYYGFNYDNHSFFPITLQGKLQHYEGLNSYQHGFGPFFSVQHTLYSYALNAGYVEIDKFNTLPRSLQVAYIYDDKMYIDGRVMRNTGHTETMDFVGSLVDVKSGCDGGGGEIPVVVHYYHFFKDKDKVYVYSTEKQSLRILENVKPAAALSNDFDQMNTWVKKV